METEVTSSTTEGSHNFENISTTQSSIKGFNSRDTIEQKNNESAEVSSNETKVKVNKNNSGASPKLPSGHNTKKSIDECVQSICDDESISGDCQYFFEDEIFRIDKKGRAKFGLVLETAGTYSGDEDDEFDDVLEKGELCVVWYPEFTESIEPENSIGLADRTLMPGDVVRRLVPGKETQRGYCRDINMKADVKVLGTKYVIKNVNAERLKIISNWQRDSAVCLDSWVGSTKDVEEKAILRTANGCLIEISSSDFYNFQDLNSRRQRDIFYPGNTITGTLPPMENIKILTPDIPLHTNKKGKPLTRKFTIKNVYTDSVCVNWQCKALSDEADLEEITLQPNRFVTGSDIKRLKRLNLFESCMLQIVDRNYLTYSSCDTLVRKANWDKEQSIKFKKIFQEQKEQKHKIFVRTSYTGAAGAVGTHHHYEKVKKKLSLSLDDKSSNKLKRTLFKGDKLGKRDISHEMNSHEKSMQKNLKVLDAEWLSTEEDEAEIDEDNCDIKFMDVDNVAENRTQYTEDCNSTTTTISTCSSSSPHTSPKHFTKRQLKRKTRKVFKKPFLGELSPEFQPKEGDELVTEALLVYSTATVVWQDGTIESDIPSTQLYPIHHLDNHEFFPGDFVISAKEDLDLSHRDYGVIQTVDHEARIAHVKWFTTYTSADEPKPTYKGESECSVYDLKDQPDFQYRPGTMVIRVANFVAEDAKCTAGQVIDNYIDGRVKVWWVDGHISLCWPQDLFEFGQLDQGDVSHVSEESWETESENSEIGYGDANSLKLSASESDILLNIQQTSVSLSRLQEILNMNPNLQNSEVMHNLLKIYKSCRFLDRLLNTTFFHEDNFMGLIERVRKVGSQSMHAEVQVNSQTPNNQKQQNQCSSVVLGVAGVGNTNINSATAATANVHKCHQSLSAGSLATSSKEFAPRVLFAVASTSFKCPHNHSYNNNSNSPLSTLSAFKKRSLQSAGTVAEGKETPVDKLKDTCGNDPSIANHHTPTTDISPNENNEYNAEKYLLLNSIMKNIEKAYEKTTLLTAATVDNASTPSRNENFDCSSTSYTSSSETNNFLTKNNDNQKSINQSTSSIELPEDAPKLVCERLCSLLKKQLVKCLNEICEKYYKGEQQQTLNDTSNIDLINNHDKNTETIVDTDCSKATLKTPEHDEHSIRAEEKVENDSTSKKPSALHFPPAPTGLASRETVNRTTKKASLDVSSINQECFQILSNAPKNHKYKLTFFHPKSTQQYYKAVQREHRLLKTSLPPGVRIKVFEDRMDLMSVMIEGPKHTPYEDGLFFFDFQLGRDYPKSPPLCHYISYCSERLNPNLYEDGKVCISLLGTWLGKDTEMWGPNSTLFQVIVSIQGLILVPEPYFNEAGYEKQKGTQQGTENSRMYNEMVIIKLIQATTKLIQNPPEIFQDEIRNHFEENGIQMYERIKGWMELSKQMPSNVKENPKQNEKSVGNSTPTYSLPDFPLVPASRGFCLTLAGLLENFKQRMDSLNDNATPSKGLINQNAKPTLE